MSQDATKVHQDFWTARRVAWYQRANERSDYAERVFGAAASLLAGARTALDVGAGFGALAIPLAARLERVTALEPAAAMAGALRAEAARRRLDNLSVIEAAWGEVVLPPHDLVLCAHVGPLLERGGTFLREAPALARRGVILVRDMPGGDDKFFFSELYPRFLGRGYDRCCDYEETLEEVGALGIVPAVTPIEYASDQPFATLDEACDFWMEYMGLEGEDARVALRTFLARRLRRDGRGWIAPLRKRAAVIHWRVGPEEPAR
ncbi:MAG: class I SAM-dependent methyltransferase [Candidatus Rokubacteria bacterium]|nr:class I SAM-dependent methyltransferase [Candidatus Rokubacteria bacterium]